MELTTANSISGLKRALILALLGLAATVQAQFIASGQTSQERKTRNVVVVMLDGLRWEEVFRGADPELINKKGPRMLGASAQRTALAKELYWRDDPIQRRQVLMPFLWQVFAAQGQIFGNRDLGSKSQVRNHEKFSYPGYNETLTGKPDDRRIHSNRNVPNPNITVLEWLNNKPEFHGKVAAFGAWEVFDGIFNRERCGFLVNSGYRPMEQGELNPQLELLNELKDKSPRVWMSESFDLLPFYTAVEYVKLNKPRVLFIGLGETDDWAHMGSYPEYLNAVNRDDQYLKELWTLLQSMPEYRDETTLIVLPDHGRGSGPLWKLHALPVPGAGQTWMAFLGPDTPALGERIMSTPVTDAQIAATIAAVLGQDYNAEMMRAAKPIEDVLYQPVQVARSRAAAIEKEDERRHLAGPANADSPARFGGAEARRPSLSD
jgi:hypothetical protein